MAIVELMAKGAISAASCVVHGRWFGAHAPELQKSADWRSLGLHLTLTETASEGLRTNLQGWLRRCYLTRRVDRNALRAEINRQLDSFSRQFGRPPD